MYLDKISKFGRGPDEYKSVYGAILFDDRVYIEGFLDYFRAYDLKGNYINTIMLNPDNIGFATNNVAVTLNNSIPERFPLEDHKFAAYHFNGTGQIDKLITIYDHEGNTVEEFPNKNLLYRKGSWIGGFSKFYQYRENILFREQSNDTTFCVTENGLIPYMVLQLNPDQKISYEKLDTREPGKIFYTGFHETDTYLLAKTIGGNIYLCDKETAKVTYYPNDRMSNFAKAIFSNPFNKQYSDKFITFLYPYDYLDAVEDGSLPKELNSLNIQENDNPIFLEITFK